APPLGLAGWLGIAPRPLRGPRARDLLPDRPRLRDAPRRSRRPRTLHRLGGLALPEARRQRAGNVRVPRTRARRMGFPGLAPRPARRARADRTDRAVAAPPLSRSRLLDRSPRGLRTRIADRPVLFRAGGPLPLLHAPLGSGRRDAPGAGALPHPLGASAATGIPAVAAAPRRLRDPLPSARCPVAQRAASARRLGAPLSGRRHRLFRPGHRRHARGPSPRRRRGAARLGRSRLPFHAFVRFRAETREAFRARGLPGSP